MLPGDLGERVGTARNALVRLCPAVASIKIRMEIHAIGLLVQRDQKIARAMRQLKLACLDYLNCAAREKETHSRGILKLIDKLEYSLASAQPSDTAIRFGKGWRPAPPRP